MRVPTKTDHRRGEEHPASRLTDAAVRDLRQKYREGWSWRAMGKLYGVSPFTAKLAATGQTWRHVV